jgi:ribosome-associated toxin RatA of RatAB toxin-antitoxin module
MGQIHVEASAVIPASAEKLYRIVSDYRTHHPQILPKQYFERLEVVAGGIGAGTVVNAYMRVMGTAFEYHLVVSEPEPGRVLAEEDTTKGTHTTFTFKPLNTQSTELTIATDAKTSNGFMGWMEQMTMPGIMRQIYEKELKQIADYVVTVS